MINYKKIYDEIFKPEYRYCYEDNLLRYTTVLEFIKVNNISSIIDIGSGRGQILTQIQKYNPKIQILSTDLNKYHTLDIPFQNIDLSNNNNIKRINGRYDLLICLDVIEHIALPQSLSIPKLLKPLALYHIFTIANHSDTYYNNTELHLTQISINKWFDIIQQEFTILEFTKHFNDRLGIFICCAQ